MYADNVPGSPPICSIRDWVKKRHFVRRKSRPLCRNDRIVCSPVLNMYLRSLKTTRTAGSVSEDRDERTSVDHCMSILTFSGPGLVILGSGGSRGAYFRGTGVVWRRELC